jgi:hypothetical protein
MKLLDSKLWLEFEHQLYYLCIKIYNGYCHFLSYGLRNMCATKFNGLYIKEITLCSPKIDLNTPMFPNYRKKTTPYSANLTENIYFNMFFEEFGGVITH